MSKTSSDPPAGWFGVAIGVVFIGLSLPGLAAYFSGEVPTLTIKQVRLTGFDALAASMISALGGLYAAGKGLVLLLRRPRHEA